MATDKTLTCRDCGKPFVFTAGEQEFYQTKGFNEPVRCPSCRAARKNSRPEGASVSRAPREYGSSSAPAMARSDRSGGRPERQMYAATCDNCGEPTTVPFKPTNGKPVYCRDCYAMMKA